MVQCDLSESFAYKVSSGVKTYLINMKVSILILWCYVTWYLTMVIFYMKTDIDLWMNSLGISLLVGFALVLATGGFSKSRVENELWQIVRLFLCPFLVSSFSNVTLGENFFLVFSPNFNENLLAVTFCSFIVIIYSAIKSRNRQLVR